MSSFTIGYFPVLLLAGGFLYMIFITVTKQVQVVLNLMIAQFGVITEQTVSAASFGAGILVASPAIVLIAVGIWALVRAASEGS